VAKGEPARRADNDWPPAATGDRCGQRRASLSAAAAASHSHGSGSAGGGRPAAIRPAVTLGAAGKGEPAGRSAQTAGPTGERLVSSAAGLQTFAGLAQGEPGAESPPSRGKSRPAAGGGAQGDKGASGGELVQLSRRRQQRALAAALPSSASSAGAGCVVGAGVGAAEAGAGAGAPVTARPAAAVERDAGQTLQVDSQAQLSTGGGGSGSNSLAGEQQAAKERRAKANATGKAAAAAPVAAAAADDENKREEEKATTIKCITNCQTSEGRSQASLLLPQRQRRQQQVNSSNGNSNYNNSGDCNGSDSNSGLSERNRNNSDPSVSLAQRFSLPSAPTFALVVAKSSQDKILFDKINKNNNNDHPRGEQAVCNIGAIQALESASLGTTVADKVGGSKWSGQTEKGHCLSKNTCNYNNNNNNSTNDDHQQNLSSVKTRAQTDEIPSQIRDPRDESFPLAHVYIPSSLVQSTQPPSRSDLNNNSDENEATSQHQLDDRPTFCDDYNLTQNSHSGDKGEVNQPVVTQGHIISDVTQKDTGNNNRDKRNKCKREPAQTGGCNKFVLNNQFINAGQEQNNQHLTKTSQKSPTNLEIREASDRFGIVDNNNSLQNQNSALDSPDLPKSRRSQAKAQRTNAPGSSQPNIAQTHAQPDEIQPKPCNQAESEAHSDSRLQSFNKIVAKSSAPLGVESTQANLIDSLDSTVGCDKQSEFEPESKTQLKAINAVPSRESTSMSHHRKTHPDQTSNKHHQPKQPSQPISLPEKSSNIVCTSNLSNQQMSNSLTVEMTGGSSIDPNLNRRETGAPNVTPSNLMNADPVTNTEKNNNIHSNKGILITTSPENISKSTCNNEGDANTKNFVTDRVSSPSTQPKDRNHEHFDQDSDDNRDKKVRQPDQSELSEIAKSDKLTSSHTTSAAPESSSSSCPIKTKVAETNANCSGATELAMDSVESIDKPAGDESQSPVMSSEQKERTTNAACNNEDESKTSLNRSNISGQDDQPEIKQRVPSHLPANNRSILILREIDPKSSESSVRDIFNSENCPSKPVHCEYALHNSWYVTFKDDEDAKQALAYIRKYIVTWKGQPIMARYKPKPAAPSTSNQPPPNIVPPMVIQSTQANGAASLSSAANMIADQQIVGTTAQTTGGISAPGLVPYHPPDHSIIHPSHIVPHPHPHQHHHHHHHHLHSHPVPSSHHYGYSAVAYYGQPGSMLTPWPYSNAPQYDLSEVFIFNGLVPYPSPMKTNNNKMMAHSASISGAALLGGEMAYQHHIPNSSLNTSQMLFGSQGNGAKSSGHRRNSHKNNIDYKNNAPTFGFNTAAANNNQNLHPNHNQSSSSNHSSSSITSSSSQLSGGGSSNSPKHPGH